MPTAQTLVAAFQPLADEVAKLDLVDAPAATAALNASMPLSSLGELQALCEAALQEGWLAPKAATPTLSFGRLSKPTAALHGMSIDVVDMEGAGAAHTHPKGEVSLCFVQSGEPRFCGHPPGWVVVPPGSRHVPEVTGGRMLIFYFLPDGAMVWG